MTPFCRAIPPTRNASSFPSSCAPAPGACPAERSADVTVESIMMSALREQSISVTKRLPQDRDDRTDRPATSGRLHLALGDGDDILSVGVNAGALAGKAPPHTVGQIYHRSQDDGGESNRPEDRGDADVLPQNAPPNRPKVMDICPKPARMAIIRPLSGRSWISWYRVMEPTIRPTLAAAPNVRKATATQKLPLSPTATMQAAMASTDQYT